MKLRVLLPILIAVVTGHVVIFWILPKASWPDSSEETGASGYFDPEVESAEPWLAAPDSESGQETASLEMATSDEPVREEDLDGSAVPGGSLPAADAVGRAVALVRSGRDRTSSADRGDESGAAGSGSAPQPTRAREAETSSEGGDPADVLSPDAIPLGAMRVGRARAMLDLPPEVAEPARQGALAVADEDWETARRHYLEMVRLAPDNALGYANLGVAEYQLGNLLAAAGNLTRSLEINPSIAQNWQTLGLIHYERGHLELAISSLARALHEDASDARSRVYLAAVASDYGWRDAALLELQRAVESDPSLVDAHFNLALAYLDESPPRIELARRHYYAARDLGNPPAPEIEASLKGEAGDGESDLDRDPDTDPESAAGGAGRP